MKKDFFNCPETIDESNLYGFSWFENVLAIPSPMVCVTSYKENGLPNATMQSWCTFSGDEGYHVLFSSVNHSTHMYSSVIKNKCFVVNFPSKDNFMKCYSTIENNNYDIDEITASGLNVGQASKINAPLIEECFLNIECELEWTKELVTGGYHSVICAKVVGIHFDDEHFDNKKLGRYGETGYLYNIHNPIDPFTGESSGSQLGIIQSLGTY